MQFWKLFPIKLRNEWWDFIFGWCMEIQLFHLFFQTFCLPSVWLFDIFFHAFLLTRWRNDNITSWIESGTDIGPTSIRFGPTQTHFFCVCPNQLGKITSIWNKFILFVIVFFFFRIPSECFVTSMTSPSQMVTLTCQKRWQYLDYRWIHLDSHLHRWFGFLLVNVLDNPFKPIKTWQKEDS